MLRQVLFMLALIAAALVATVAMVPGEREQWTMLIRDSRNEEALALIEAHYRAGLREPSAVLQYYRLLMSFADVVRATRVIEEFVATRPRDPQGLALLAKHYDDTQNRQAEVRTLERLFEVLPSAPTATALLTLYRLDGAFEREEELLHALLATSMIAANDAERLGLILFARGDLEGARIALSHFDAIAHRDQMIGRLALFDVLTELGDGETARAKAEAWVPDWRRIGAQRPTGFRVSAARLNRMMDSADNGAAGRITCAAYPSDAPSRESEKPQNAACPSVASEAVLDAQEHPEKVDGEQTGEGSNERSDGSSDRH
jgi:tetratricopeptide (TPR) repeat protein